MSMNEFEPKIIAFCCEYCGYAAADMAGSLRLAYPANIKVIKVPCTGRIDVLTVIKTFENGIDGILLFGCLEGSCHFVEGNLRAKRRIAYVRELLNECGIGGDRVAMFNTSAAMGVQFAQYANEAVDKAGRRHFAWCEKFLTAPASCRAPGSWLHARPPAARAHDLHGSS
jgi:coenzyme F420-reducing hydrogenase delta subunit